MGALKFTNPPLHHDAGLAVMLAGTFGFPLMVIVLGMLLPGVQSDVVATTVKEPVLNVDDTLSRIVVLPCPLVIVVPAGLVHV